MNSIETLRQFFGWCAVINIGVLLLSTIMITLFRGTAMKLHVRLFGLREEEMPREYFRYLARYKIATLILAVVPYLALRMMA